LRIEPDGPLAYRVTDSTAEESNYRSTRKMLRVAR